MVAHEGQVLERRGDGLLIKFAEPRNATLCAHELHHAALRANERFIEGDAIYLRIGIHTADVLSEVGAIYGRGINLAARIAALAGPGETVASDAVRDQITTGIDADVFDLGECHLKHAASTLHAFRMLPVGADAAQKRLLAPESVVRPSVAVLPFDVHGVESTANANSLSDLVGEGINHGVSRIDQISAISWMSCRALRGRGLSAVDAMQALGASWIVGGGVYVDGTTLLITFELTRADQPQVELTGRIRTDVRDLMSSESESAGEIAYSVVQRIVELETKRVSRHALPNLASHSILTGAIGLMHRSGKENFVKSRNALEYLLERHPRMHAVRPWLAQWYVLRNTRGFAIDAKDDAARAVEQANRALDALPDDSRALALLGFTHFHLLGDVQTAQTMLDASIRMNANDPLASIFCAAVKSVQQLNNEGWALSLQALKIAPFDPLRDYMRGMAAGCAMSAGAIDTAVELATASIRENAAHPYAWRVLLIAQTRSGNIDAARAAYQRLCAMNYPLAISSYVARSKLSAGDLGIAVDALRMAGVPE